MIYSYTFKIEGNIVLPKKIITGSIDVVDGKISKISEDKSLRSKIYILPGLIEVHGHFREPGLATKGDVPHESRAGLAGGFTTVIDMPNVKPPTTTVKLLRDKIHKIYPNRSYMDYSFFMGVSKDDLKELEKVDPSWIVGVKVFTAGHETTPTTIPDSKTLNRIFTILKKRKILLAIHAEDQNLINHYNEKYKKLGRKDPALWSEVRPKDVVVSAVAKAIALSEIHDQRVYLLHLSTAEEFALVNQAKKHGIQAYGELVGYQLFFNINDYKKYGNKIKVAPALRSTNDQNELWNLLRNGEVDTLCSEHTPHEWQTKSQSDMWKAQSGTPGIQETVPAFLTNWSKRYGKSTLNQALLTLARLAGQNPAEILNFKTKGSIEIGKDADFTLINPTKNWKVKKKDLFSKCGWSAYEGMNLIGRPEATYLRGRLVYKDGKVLGKAQGKWMKNIA